MKSHIFNLRILNKLIALLLTAIIFFVIATPVYAANGAKPHVINAVRSNSVVTLNNQVHRFHTFNLFGQNHIRIRDLASMLSGSLMQFSVDWNSELRIIQLQIGRPYNPVGGELSLRPTNVKTGTFTNTRISINNNEHTLSTIHIGGETFFRTRDIADAMGFSLRWNPESRSITLGAGSLRIEYTTTPYEGPGSTVRLLDPNRPVVALTFDDGPSSNTNLVLDALGEHGVPATFFVLGSRISANSATLRRTANAGHEIASHAWSHRSLTRLSNEQIRTEVTDTSNAIRYVTGITPTLLRTPYGATNRRVEGVLESMGFPLIHWSLDTRDWESRSQTAIFNATMNHVRDRDIILMHDIHEPTAHAVRRIVPALLTRGYQFVTVSELMCYSRITLMPGIEYRHGR